MASNPTGPVAMNENRRRVAPENMAFFIKTLQGAQQAQQMRAQAQQMLDQATRLEGAAEFYVAHLREMMGLAQHEGFDSQGFIVEIPGAKKDEAPQDGTPTPI